MKIFLLTLSIIFAGIFSALPLSQDAMALDNNAKSGFNKGITDTGRAVEGQAGLTGTIQNVINILLYLSGIIAVVIIVIGAIRFITSEGDSNSTNKAKNTVVYAVIGLIVVVLSYAIVNFVLDQFS